MTGLIDGVYNIMATPFTPDGAIDFASLRRLVDFQIDKGAYGLTIMGVLGEASKLTVEERKQVVSTVMETVAGRIPVIVGTSHNDTSACLELSKEAVAAGAAGIMATSPPFDKSSDALVMAFYENLGHAVDCPIVVQDYPPVNNIQMSADLLAAIAERVPHARYLKLEDPPLMQKIRAICQRTNRYKIFGGLGGMFFLEELEAGAAGTMTGFAFTEILVAVYRAFREGKRDEAERIFDHYLPLIRFENQPVINLCIRKELLYRRGAIDSPTLRPPFAALDAGTLSEISWILDRVGISDPTKKLDLNTGVH